MNRPNAFFVFLSSTYTSLKTKWQISGLASIEILLLASILLGLFLGTIGFLFGKVCSPFPMTFSFLIGTIFAFLYSWKRGIFFICLTFVFLILTAYTFSYTGTDAQNYHFPMQHLIKSGWNPIFDSTIERFNTVANLGHCSLYHTLFLPKLTALSGAFIASATGLWVADAFLGYVLIFVLFLTSFRFANNIYSSKISIFSSLIFAGFITFSTKITSFLAGQIDYTVYAAFIIALMSLCLYKRTLSIRDCVLFYITLLIAMLSKSTGLICGMLTLIVGCLFLLKRPIFRWGCVLFFFFTIIIGLSPFLTSWIQYGHPLYPAATFATHINPVDITSDFTGNTDALSMGYISRIIYAWISKALAIKGCAWYFNNPDFSPIFTVAGGVGGLGVFFKFLTFGSFVALLFSKKNIVFWLCIFIFLTSNLAPLKYIGYNRYFPQIWVIPALAFYNFIYFPKNWMPSFINKWTKPCVLVLFITFSMLSLLRTLAYQGRMFVFEKTRQEELLKIKNTQKTYYLMEALDSYTFRQRMKIAGVKVEKNQDLSLINFDDQFDIASLQNINIIINRLNNKYPICDSISEVLKFPYYPAFKSLPFPNMEK